MGILLIPIFLAMFLGFSYLGIKSGGQAILRAQGRLTASILLIAMTTALITAEIVLPFALVASTRVSAGGFIVAVVFTVAGVAGLAGTYFTEQYRKTNKPMHGLSAGAFFLAAANFPITWLWFAERMEEWFLVAWDY